MLTYGLTGGIGSGKSTVGKMFAALAVPVFDADAIGRTLLSSDTALAGAVRQRFPGCGKPNGIDRLALARQVFADDRARAALEALLHPAILEEFCLQRDALPRGPGLPPYCLLEGALLGDTATPYPLAGLVLVTAPEALRRRRVATRDGLDDAGFQARRDAQRPAHEKLLMATHTIDNCGTLEDTRQRVIAVHRLLLEECGGEP
jgi:dephospho-CoA kinase